MGQETFSIHSGPTAQHEFAANALKLVTANAVAWGIPEARVTKLTASFSDYDAKFAITSNPSTQSPAATVARNTAWDVVKVDLNDVYKHNLLNNDAISSADKDTLHINVSGGGKSITPAPTTTPIISLTSEEIGALRVIYSDSSAPGTHYKPDNVVFCELCYKIGGTAPVTPAECNESANISRSHAALQFTPESRGKTVYVFARWVNRNGKTGSWSGMVTALVP
ncbi:MAG: hypothetical protein PHS84_09225 [Paludibacter sp.]|nr:hypothetical protein [Paludibacter sp.]